MTEQIGAWLFLEYLESRELVAEGHRFYALIMAAMRQADIKNLAKLKSAWPELWKELMARYHAPRGALTQNEMAYLAGIKEDI